MRGLLDDDPSRMMVVGHRRALEVAMAVQINHVSSGGSVNQSGTLVVLERCVGAACRVIRIRGNRFPQRETTLGRCQLA